MSEKLGCLPKFLRPSEKKSHYLRNQESDRDRFSRLLDAVAENLVITQSIDGSNDGKPTIVSEEILLENDRGQI